MNTPKPHEMPMLLPSLRAVIGPIVTDSRPRLCSGLRIRRPRVARAAIVSLLAAGCPWVFASEVRNLALSEPGVRARSWEPGVAVIPGHEPSKAKDGRLHTYWSVRPE